MCLFVVFIAKLSDRWASTQPYETRPNNAHEKVHGPKSCGTFLYFWSRESKKSVTNSTFLFRNMFSQGTLILVPRAFPFKISKGNVLRTKLREISFCPPALNREFIVSTWQRSLFCSVLFCFFLNKTMSQNVLSRKCKRWLGNCW